MKELRKIVLALLFTSICAPMAMAQNSDNSEESRNALEEVIVTAQKRDESLQDVPFAISAFTAEALRKNRIDNYLTLSQSAAGLSVWTDGVGRNEFVIRGVATSPTGRDKTAIKEKVGVYINEMPIADATYTPQIDFFDVNRIEVLRGPQGTLFGAGSLAGTVRVITNAPDPSAFQSRIEMGISTVSGGNMGYEAKAMLNVPLKEETSAIRGVFYQRDEGGFIDNSALGQTNVNDSETTGGRLMGLFNITDRFSAKASVFYDKREIGGITQEDVFTAPPFPDFQPGRNKQYRETDEPMEDQFKAASLELNYDGDNMNFVSATSFIDGSADRKTDEARFMDVIFGLPDQSFWVEDLNDFEVFSQEFRIASAGDGRFDWVTGAYYSTRERSLNQLGFSPGFDDLTGVPSQAFGVSTADTLFDYYETQDLEQYALFGEIAYPMTDKLTFTTGLRWYDVKEDAVQDAAGFFFGGTVFQEASFSKDGFNPRFILDYAVSENVSVAAQASKGFRLGGSTYPVNEDLCKDDLEQIGVSEPPTQFDNETLWNYELSLKSTLADGRVVANASLFTQDYENLIQSISLPCGFALTGNLGAAKIKGAEFELQAAINENWSVSANATYLDPEIEDSGAFLNLEEGQRLPLSPEFSAAANLHFYSQLSNAWELDGDLNFQYVDEMLQNLQFDDVKTDSYQLVSTQLRVSSGKWSLTAYVDNVFDEEAELAKSVALGTIRTAINRPRTFGLQLGIDFQ